jgi:DNA repair protein RecO (recombination protein O)
MTAPRSYQVEALIVKRIKLGEADRILTLYTPSHGKLRAIAKGNRRPGSKLGGHVELLTHSQLLLARGHNLDIISQAQTINSFMPLKEQLKLTTLGFYILELIDDFTSEEVNDPELFNFIIETLRRLCEGKNIESVMRYFELQMLDRAGYRPQLQKCVSCDAPLQPAVNYFSPAQGGVLCVDCGFEEPVCRTLSLNALKVLRLWQNTDYTNALRVNIHAELALEMEMLLRDYLRYILERQIKSTEFLDKLR